jgi:8-oxo-dGTP diphosphatase
VKQLYAYYDREEPRTADGFKYCPYCRTELVIAERDHEPRPTCPACGFIHFRNPFPTVSILVVQEGQVLLGRRTGRPGAGTWAIPSGYVEYGDDFLAAAVREVKEETGLDVEIRSIINLVSSFVSPRFHFLGIYVLAAVAGGELAAGDDLEVVGWFPLAGPLPELGFQEDADVIAWYATNRAAALPVDLEFARPRISSGTERY